MKNIFLLPTPKPSRLLYFGTSKELTLQVNSATFRAFSRSPQNIYITDNLEIKVGDWVITNNGLLAKVITELAWHFINSKKIILTTDQDLIKDGIQAIDDEFLDWFVNNSSCESVEIANSLVRVSGFNWKTDYKIIIPKEEPKQETEHLLSTETNKKRLLEDVSKQEELSTKLHIGEVVDESYPKNFIKQETTLEEAAHKMLINYGIKSMGQSIGVLEVKKLMVNFAKWQQEQDKNKYSEEEVFQLTLDALDLGMKIRQNQLNGHSDKSGKELHSEWFEQFSKLKNG
jgi:hypothetical protein